MSSRTIILERVRWHIAALRVRTALTRSRLALRAFNPAQPRVPAGNPDGGQWTDGQNGGAHAQRDDGQVLRVSDEGGRRYTVVLAEEEARGGHTLREHVGKADEQMLERVRASRRRFPFVTFGLRRDGSFESIESANNLVNRTLESNYSEVNLVADGKKPSAFLKARFGYKTGREAYTAGRLEPYLRTTYGVGVFILHDPDSIRGYRIYTAYPRNDGD